MKKDVLFLVSNESGWESRLSTARQLLGDVTLIQGENTILDSFKKCSAAARTELFVLIDGDNIVLPEAVDALNGCSAPTVFFTTNKYGVVYGHGGVKVVSKNSNLNMKVVTDVTAKLSLSIDHRVISVHDFGFTEYNEWKTIFKELIKLFLWGNRDLLREWLKHDVPKSIFKYDVRPFLEACSLRELSSLNSNHSLLRSLYEKSSNCGNLQKRID